MGVLVSVAHFDDGNIATLNTFDEIGLEHGHYTTIGCKKGNTERANNSMRKSGEGYRLRRKYIRDMKKCKGDALKKKRRQDLWIWTIYNQIIVLIIM